VGALDGLLEVAKDVVPSLVTGVGGAFATLWKLGHALLERVSKLEKRFGILAAQTDGLDVDAKALRADLAALAAVVHQLKGELENLRRGSVTTEKHARLYEKMAAVERRASDMDAELTRQMDMLTAFVKDQNEQWQSMSRLMGQLEGQLEWLTKSKK